MSAVECERCQFPGTQIDGNNGFVRLINEGRRANFCQIISDIGSCATGCCTRLLGRKHKLPSVSCVSPLCNVNCAGLETSC